MKDLFGNESIPPEEYFTDEQKNKWYLAFVNWCNNEYFTKGDILGRFCCGYDWCCDECEMIHGEACYDCADTLLSILKRNNIQFDYNNYDFEYWENKAKEFYANGN